MMMAGIAISRLFQRIQVPDVIGLLGFGLVLGPSGLGLSPFRFDSLGTQILITAGAAYILLRGGMSVDHAIVRPVWLTILLLATIGVLVTAAITAVPASILFGVTPVAGLLIAAVIASTDPATLIPILERIHLKPRVRQALVTESALNDATGAILTLTVLTALLGHTASPAAFVLQFVWLVALGFAIGVAIGVLAAWLCTENSWLERERGLVILGAAIASYGVAEAVGGSGFMASFVAGVVLGALGRSKSFRPASMHLQYSDHYLDVSTDLFRILVFALLGSSIDMSRLAPQLPVVLIVVLVFITVARPVAVLVCALPDRRAHWSWQELTFLSWSRQTGVVPAVLVGILASLHSPYIAEISAVTTVAILLTIVIQGATAGWAARRLHLTVCSSSDLATPGTRG
jgi:potassium/hydrogen antiporter